MTRETEYELTLEERLRNTAEAEAAVIAIAALVGQCNAGVSKVLAELKEAIDNDVTAFDGDWISNLEKFQDELCHAIELQLVTT